jgi:hypothetical protein
MEDSATALVLLLEYGKLLKSAREIQLIPIETGSFRVAILAAQTTVQTRKAAQEVNEFIQNPLGHPIAQVRGCALGNGPICNRYL